MATVLITGANRGVGLGLVSIYAQAKMNVIACCRSPNKAIDLQSLADQYENVCIETCDVTNQAHINALAQKIKVPIDILLLNAGVYGDIEKFGDVTKENMMKTFEVNAVAPLMITQAFSEHVAKSELKQVVAMTSRMGSLADNSSGRRYMYRASKAGLNIIMKSLAIDLAPLGIHVTIIHPGWVKTEMGGPNALLSIEEGAQHIKSVIEKARNSEAGQFYHANGDVLPW
jgi:NAD(P)-dependent dehydrogenase (short-subunit alcohol dehydrogenase family)